MHVPRCSLSLLCPKVYVWFLNREHERLFEHRSVRWEFSHSKCSVILITELSQWKKLCRGAYKLFKMWMCPFWWSFSVPQNEVPRFHGQIQREVQQNPFHFPPPSHWLPLCIVTCTCDHHGTGLTTDSKKACGRFPHVNTTPCKSGQLMENNK